MKVLNPYNKWLKNAVEDKDIIDELNSIKDNKDEVYERFYKNLEFGTAGLRGLIGAGTNRMNIYVVRHTTQGLANYIKKNYHGDNCVAISYDSRIKADLFAIEAAKVLAANNIKVYLTKELQPTPVLSFLVRNFKCKAGIMITASHNPAEYNGYKAYDSTGCQMTDIACNNVYNEISNLDIFKDITIMDFNKGLESGKIEYVDDSVYDSYLEKVKEQQINKDACLNSDLNVVYTPLNGTGNKLVRKVLKEIGLENLHIVKEQELPDGNFPTAPYPNPELKEALNLGLKLSEDVNADILIATDPDADRVGVAVKNTDNTYRILTGNETGILLSDYILSSRDKNNTLPENPIIVKTIVTSILVERIAKKYNCKVKDVLTGFKYIGEVILTLEEKEEVDRFVFGFEESCGYLAGSYVRDKDAVLASMLVCEMAAHYKKENKSLAQVIDNLYEEYGFYKNTTISFDFKGSAGMKKMSKLMLSLRKTSINSFNGFNVVKVADYLNSVEKDLITNDEKAINLPKANVMAYSLEGGNAVIVRPSGTEPKIKVYVTAVGKDEKDAHNITDNLIADIKETLNLE